MKEITLEARIENLPALIEFVDGYLEEIACSMKAQMQIDIAVDEIFTNISSYAYTPGVGEATVEITKRDSESQVELTFIDSGVPYNPLEKADPDVTLSAEERQIGGLGIFMVKRTMDEMTYEYKDGKNILTIRKKFA